MILEQHATEFRVQEKVTVIHIWPKTKQLFDRWRSTRIILKNLDSKVFFNLLHMFHAPNLGLILLKILIHISELSSHLTVSSTKFHTTIYHKYISVC